jgi:hypothetical protein
VYTIDYERKMAVNKVPFGSYYLQDLGRTRRVMRGEGEFVGDDAYAQFGALANTFYETGPGLLIHPLWQTANAYFVELRLEQEPRPDYVRYSFAFWEATDLYSGTVRELSVQSSTSGTVQSRTSSTAQSSGSKVHRVVSGDNLWTLAAKYGLTMTELLQLNPQIKNPNLIYPGDEVIVG